MEKEIRPKVKVTILPDVYDPERYRRGMEMLRQAFGRAIVERVREHSDRRRPQ
ncbi:MAG TPA: hypothetical protein VD973_29465 [Symbiobacteriaceae bacterium]|nr:hypothetical protein [Symbiobacteriaceae bacterium]